MRKAKLRAEHYRLLSKASAEYASGTALIERAEMTDGGYARGKLKDLVRLGFLHSQRGKGYALTAKGEAFLETWFQSLVILEERLEYLPNESLRQTLLSSGLSPAQADVMWAAKYGCTFQQERAARLRMRQRQRGRCCFVAVAGQGCLGESA